MKKDKTQNINFKKLTIARINIDAMRKIEGGTSVLTSALAEETGVIIDFCYNEK
ncbi:class I lanthipeptide [Aquimarina sp. 2201CG14-23]|uniref:class I lanthipeptide n=1 Tax=Aquimarina mycalae TaxID=3040073 RepID=UPI002477D3C1|nr:class I lanthipeptide [Aquimarina sp. 2201CG14-23]MDH7447080.1 class I lanthipeptide [Aquimarina sp. 2201CG14-23]